MLKDYEKDYSKYSTHPKTLPINTDPFNDSECMYVVKVHDDHKENLKIDLKDGGEVNLVLTQKFNNNFREALPQECTIVEVSGKGQFKKGDRLITYHFAFVNDHRVTSPFKTVDNVELYELKELDIIAKINDDKTLTPRKGVSICEPILDKLIDTTLELVDNDIDYRRDICKVLQVWEGCEYNIEEENDYLLLDEGGDYLFKHENKNYLCVDFYWDSAIGITNNPKWRNKETKRHMKDHNDFGYGGEAIG